LNLTNPDDIGTPERKKKLISLNFPNAFKIIINDPKIDVRNKVKEILKHFEEPVEKQSYNTLLMPLNRSESLLSSLSLQNNNQCKYYLLYLNYFKVKKKKKKKKKKK